MSKVLIVEDQSAVRTALEVLFSLRGGLDVLTAEDPTTALAAIDAGGVGVVVQDMNFSAAVTSGDEGVALFRAIRERDASVAVILMTAWSSLETAVALVREGADDYLEKPWDDERLLAKVKALLAARAVSTPASPAGYVDQPELCGLVYESGRMHAAVRLATKVARADVPILITGENGSGKERIAQIIEAASGRPGPFLTVNAGALPDELLEAELFGAEAGAFTGAKKRRAGRFEAADGGTLFLDEIGNMSTEGQGKLLRVLQTGEFERLGSSVTQKVDVRVLAATNVDMKRAIAEGRFREDLYYRLAVVEVAVPPLRERPEDILPLARHFLAAFGQELGVTPVPSFDRRAETVLLAHRWPGNVRELSNAVRRAMLVSEGTELSADDLGLSSNDAPTGPRETSVFGPADAAERDRISSALVAAGNNVTQAAVALGLSRQALYRRMKSFGLSLERKLES